MRNERLPTDSGHYRRLDGLDALPSLFIDRVGLSHVRCAARWWRRRGVVLSSLAG
jgi:hypothetical protein